LQKIFEQFLFLGAFWPSARTGSPCRASLLFLLLFFQKKIGFRFSLNPIFSEKTTQEKQGDLGPSGRRALRYPQR
jgi:hypothetical protein